VLAGNSGELAQYLTPALGVGDLVQAVYKDQPALAGRRLAGEELRRELPADSADQA
jgi:hypothetical protein